MLSCQSWFRHRGVGACAFLVLLLPMLTHAQTMYRCGSSYQDRPCNGVDSKIVGRGAAQQPVAQAAAAGLIDPACQARGASAQRLMWERESGRTLEDQLSRGGVDIDLAKAVYARRGSSVDVRRAIEAECVKEVERAKEIELLLRAANKGQVGVGVGGEPQSSRPGPSDKPVGEALSGGPSSADVARLQAKATTCASLNAELGRLSQAQREGGDAAFMDDLKVRARDAQSRKRAAGC